ncbi:MAG: hypothetical protein WCO89_13175 [Syntrophus sp. (in: bacteria)]
MGLQLALSDDMESIIAEASKRVGAKLPTGTSIEDRIARCDALRAYEQLRALITKHGTYVGPDNKASTNLKGMTLRINIMIKNVIGKPVGALTTEHELMILTRIREAVALAIAKGERQRMTRTVIKEKIRAAIENCYDIYSE